MRDQGRARQQGWPGEDAEASAVVLPQIDQEAVREQLEGRVVLVTGAGGSVGSELCRQIARHRPARLVMLDQDETSLVLSWRSLDTPSPARWEDLLLADIREGATLAALLMECRPDVVFHAAALTDRDLLERYPREAWLTNTLGTRNVLDAATRAGVGTFINLSSAEAADLSSTVGRTQNAGERLTTSWASTQLGRYVSIRPGDGSGDSRAADMTRTCQLILQASALGVDGRVVDATPRPVVAG